MFDLQLETINNSDISIQPYQYSYEELYDMVDISQIDLELCGIDSFFSTSLKELQAFSNAFDINQYVEQHGCTESLQELIGNENVITATKDILVKFAKWVWNILVKLGNFIKQAFTRKSSDSNTPAGKADALLHGTSSERTKILNEFKQADKEANHTKKSYNKSITVSINPKEWNNIKTMISDVSIDIGQIRKEFNDINARHISEHDSITKLSNILTYFQNTEEYSITRDDAIKWAEELQDEYNNLILNVKLIIANTEKVRHYNINSIKTNEDAQKFFKAISTSYKFGNESTTVDVNKVMSNIKDKIKQIQSISITTLKIDKLLTKQLIKIISQLATNRWFDKFKNGGVDVVAYLPAGLQKRISEAWGLTPNQFRLKRIFVTNIRMPEARGTTACWGYTPTVKTTDSDYKGNLVVTDVRSAYEIRINYNEFKSNKLCLMTGIANNQGIHTLGFTSKQIEELALKVPIDRIKLFFNVVIHETRHVVQGIIKKHFPRAQEPYDFELDPNKRYKKYLTNPNEIDARTAAANFKMTEEDVDWVRSLLIKCFKQEIANLKKYN